MALIFSLVSLALSLGSVFTFVCAHRRMFRFNGPINVRAQSDLGEKLGERMKEIAQAQLAREIRAGGLLSARFAPAVSIRDGRAYLDGARVSGSGEEPLDPVADEDDRPFGVDRSAALDPAVRRKLDLNAADLAAKAPRGRPVAPDQARPCVTESPDPGHASPLWWRRALWHLRWPFL